MALVAITSGFLHCLGSSAQSHLLAWRADLLAREILPNQLSICRALVSSHGAVVSGHILPSPQLGLSELLAVFPCILSLVGLCSREPVGWDGNGDNFLPVLKSFWELNLVRLFSLLEGCLTLLGLGHRHAFPRLSDRILAFSPMCVPSPYVSHFPFPLSPLYLPSRRSSAVQFSFPCLSFSHSVWGDSTLP